MRSIFSERSLFSLVPKNVNPIVCLGTAAQLRGWTSVWAGNIKVFVQRDILATTGIIHYIVDTKIGYEIYKGLPVTSEFQTIADLLTYRNKISPQVPWESFAVLFDVDEPYPREEELENYLEARGLIPQYRQLREECKSFFNFDL